MNIDLITQIWVTIFGVSALGFAQCTHLPLRRLSVILGLLGQPGWYYQLVIHEQWAMLPAFACYSFMWIWGLWNLWIRKPKP